MELKLPKNPAEQTMIEIEGVKYNTNEAGDAIDNDGKVVKTKAEIDALKTPQPTPEEIEKQKQAELKKQEIEKQLVKDAKVSIDDVEYTINDKGEAVDATGKVIKTKDELITLLSVEEEESDEIDYVKEIQKTTNIVITDDKGNPITYENSVEGISQYQQDVLQLGMRLGSEKATNELYTQYPIIKDVVTHLKLNNGRLDNFKEEIDYSGIKLDKNNIEQCKDIYIQSQVARGIPKEEAEKMSKYLVEDKTIATFAESGLQYLVSSKAERDKANADRILAMKADEKKAQDDYDTEIRDIIKTKKIKLSDNEIFSIPDIIKVKTSDGKILTKTPADFNDYLFKPMNFNIGGKTVVATQYEVDLFEQEQKQTTHHDVLKAFRLFVKNDDAQLIHSALKQQEATKVLSIKTKSVSAGGGTEDKGGKKLVLPLKK